MHVQEIRERLDPSHGKAAGGPRFGPYFRIYVGNLPRNVDSYRLRQFFNKYGKVAEARVMCHIKTKRSRGFGFVTLATKVLGFILKKNSAPTEMDEIRENSVQFRAEFGEFSEIESQNSFRT